MFEVVILNGQDYSIRFGMNALRIYCKRTNTSLQDLDKLGQDISLDDACQLILAGLQDGARVAGKDLKHYKNVLMCSEINFLQNSKTRETRKRRKKLLKRKNRLG